MSYPINAGGGRRRGVLSIVLHVLFAIENIAQLIAVAKKRVRGIEYFRVFVSASRLAKISPPIH